MNKALPKAILDNANYSIIATDVDGIIRVFNKSAERLLGYQASEVVGKLTPSIIHDVEEVIERAKILSQELGQEILPGFDVFVAKPRFLGKVDEKIWTYIHKNGTRFPVNLSVTALRDEKEEIIGFLGIAKDISEKIQTEKIKALRVEVSTAITKNRPLVESLQDCVSSIVKYLDAAFARIWTLNEKENVLELQVSAGMYTHIDGDHARILVGAFKIGLIAQERKAHLTNDVVNDPRVANKEWARKEKMIAFAGYPLIVEDKLIGVMALFSQSYLSESVLSALAAISDIIAHSIERKRIEEELRKYAEDLEKTNKELDQFAYIVSHDLKAPLRAIAHLSEWLEEDLEGKLDKDSQHKMKLIRGRVHRMEALINGILQYSRIGRVQVEIEQVDVKELLEEIVDSLTSEKNFIITIAENMPKLKTARVLLAQVFSNLISNAIKYHHLQQGHIEIKVALEENFYRFSISDDGPGIDPKYHEKIFMIFQTLEARDKVESTGIGLAIVKKIIESQKGTIEIVSDTGKGTTFYFTWPIG
ncbi:MAG: ATP-binding protein [Blastocatellia bacterium]